MSKIEEKKKEIEEKIAKNLLKKKVLIEEEKRIRSSQFKDIGRLAFQAGIDKLEKKALLGAFIEISENMTNKNIDLWTKKADELSDKPKEECELICIKFSEEAGTEIKKKLKDLKFSWNRFRKEFYGKYNLNEMKKILSGHNARIEIIEE